MAKRKKRKPLDAKEDFATPAKQDRLPGMKDAAIEEIETAAQNYDDLKYRRITALGKEIQAGQLLLAIMKKHGRTSYHRLIDDRWLHVETTETTEKVRVKFNEEAPSDAVPYNTNPGGADRESESSTPTGNQEQPEVAGTSPEVNQEVATAGDEDTPF